MKKQYFDIIEVCKNIFIDKNKKYGNSFDYFRPEGITDQILIKIKRIIKIQNTGLNLVDEPIIESIRSVINYSIINLYKNKFLEQFNEFSKTETESEDFDIINYYICIVEKCFEILEKKNHDYDNAWKDLRDKSFIDLIHVKIRRIIELEGVELTRQEKENYLENFVDIINYSVLFIIKTN